MKSFDEAREFLDRTFGADYEFLDETKEAGGADLVVNVRRKSDEAYLGYVAGMVGMEGGLPVLAVRVYLEMDVCAPYLMKAREIEG